MENSIDAELDIAASPQRETPPTRYGDMDFPGLVLALRTEEEKALFGDIVMLLLKVLTKEKLIVSIERTLAELSARVDARDNSPGVRGMQFPGDDEWEDATPSRGGADMSPDRAARLQGSGLRAKHSFRERILGIASDGTAIVEGHAGSPGASAALHTPQNSARRPGPGAGAGAAPGTAASTGTDESALRQQLLDLREDQSADLNEILERWAALHDALEQRDAAVAQLQAPPPRPPRPPPAAPPEAAASAQGSEQQLRLEQAVFASRVHDIRLQMEQLSRERGELRRQVALAARLAESARAMAEEGGAARAALARQAALLQEAAEQRAAAAAAAVPRAGAGAGGAPSGSRRSSPASSAGPRRGGAALLRGVAGPRGGGGAGPAGGATPLRAGAAGGLRALRAEAARASADRRAAVLESQLHGRRESLAASEARAMAAADEVEAAAERAAAAERRAAMSEARAAAAERELEAAQERAAAAEARSAAASRDRSAAEADRRDGVEAAARAAVLEGRLSAERVAREREAREAGERLAQVEAAWEYRLAAERSGREREAREAREREEELEGRLRDAEAPRAPLPP
eukprot:tig00021312_g20073.t1